MGKRTFFAGLTAILTAVQLAFPAAGAAQQAPRWRPQIAVVFPTDGNHAQTGVPQSRFVNVSVWPTTGVICNAIPAIPLFEARNNEPGAVVGTGQPALRNHWGYLTDFVPVRCREPAGAGAVVDRGEPAAGHLRRGWPAHPEDR